MLATVVIICKNSKFVINFQIYYIYADQSELGKNDLYKEIFYILTTAFATFIPLILLTTFNCFLVATVHRSHRIRHKMTNTRQVSRRFM